MSWPSGLAHRTQALVMPAAECGFEFWSWHLCPLSKVVHFAVPARLLVDDTHAYILTDCEGGNPVSAPGVGGNMPLLTVNLVDSQNQLSVALTLKWPSGLVTLGDISFFFKSRSNKDWLELFVTVFYAWISLHNCLTNGSDWCQLGTVLSAIV